MENHFIYLICSFSLHLFIQLVCLCPLSAKNNFPLTSLYQHILLLTPTCKFTNKKGEISQIDYSILTAAENKNYITLIMKTERRVYYHLIKKTKQRLWYFDSYTLTYLQM